MLFCKLKLSANKIVKGAEKTHSVWPLETSPFFFPSYSREGVFEVISRPAPISLIPLRLRRPSEGVGNCEIGVRCIYTFPVA
jgi:hypothetical protein